MNPDKVFKKYDIRAVIEKDLLLEEINDVAKAICTYFLQRDPSIKEIIIGIDARTHSERIKQLFVQSALEMGININYIGLCPTPLVYFASTLLKTKAAVIITASHNPKEYNGFKILYNQQPIWGEQVQEIRTIYYTKKFSSLSTHGMYRESSIVDAYLDFLEQEFKHLKNSSLSCIIDCCNGTAGVIIPQLVARMSWHNITCLFEQPDGNFPNHQPDPSKEKNLLELAHRVAEEKDTIGLAFDGDCDRFAVLQKNGKLLSGDQLLYIFAQSLPQQATVICDIKCSSSLIEGLTTLNLKSSFCQTGCAYVKEKMIKTNALLGGELSGHFCFLDRYYGFDDGIYAMMRFIEILATKPLEQLLASYPQKISSPELRIACTHPDITVLITLIKHDFMKQSNYTITDIDGVRIDTNEAWGIIRASNTEPVLSLRFEGNSEKELLTIKQFFYTTIAQYFDSEELKNNLIN